MVVLKTKFNLHIIFIFFFLSSCSNTNESFLELESCANNKLISKLNSYNNIDSNDSIINKFSLFDTIANFENQLINQKLLLYNPDESPSLMVSNLVVFMESKCSTLLLVNLFN